MLPACLIPNIGEVRQKSLGKLLNLPQLSGSRHSSLGPLTRTSGEGPPASCTAIGGRGAAGDCAAAMAAMPLIRELSFGEGTGPIFGDGVGVRPQLLLLGAWKTAPTAMSLGDAAHGAAGLSIGDGLAEDPGLVGANAGESDAGATGGGADEAEVTGDRCCCCDCCTAGGGPACGGVGGGTNSGAEGFHSLAPKPPLAAAAAAAAVLTSSGFMALSFSAAGPPLSCTSVVIIQ